MLTKIEVENFIFSLLKKSEVAAEINGGVYPDGQRPQNSQKEDAVVIMTTATAEALASGTLNILVFIPDIPQSGSKSAKVENRPRMTEVTRLLGDFAESLTVKKGYFIFSPSEAVSSDDYPELEQHAAVLRLKFKHYIHD